MATLCWKFTQQLLKRSPSTPASQGAKHTIDAAIASGCSSGSSQTSPMNEEGASTELKGARRESRVGYGVVPPAQQETRALKFDSPFDANLLAARKRSQQERLWDIFASYALQLSCEDPTRMRTANVVRLLQDCGVIDGSDSDAAKMIEKEVIIICESFIRSHSSDRDAGGKKLDFPAFLALLKNFARMAGDKDANRAYDSLVRTCLEKQKKRRPRVAIAKDFQACKKLLGLFDDPLSKIFAFYAAKTHSKLEKSDPKATLSSPARMGYAECVAWGRKYGVISHGVLTTTEFATIYIDSLPKSPPSEFDRALTYECFCEMLVRLAKKSCQRQGSAHTIEHHLKGLFQLMWLASAPTSARTMQITDLLKTDWLDVTRHFRAHFEKYWKKEHYENFLEGDLFGAASVAPGPAHSTDSRDEPSRMPPPPPQSQHQRLSLRVQTASPSRARSNSQTPRPKALQRRFSMQSPATSAATTASPAKPALRRAASVSESSMPQTLATEPQSTASLSLNELTQ